MTQLQGAEISRRYPAEVGGEPGDASLEGDTRLPREVSLEESSIEHVAVQVDAARLFPADVSRPAERRLDVLDQRDE